MWFFLNLTIHSTSCPYPVQDDFDDLCEALADRLGPPSLDLLPLHSHPLSSTSHVLLPQLMAKHSHDFGSIQQGVLPRVTVSTSTQASQLHADQTSSQPEQKLAGVMKAPMPGCEDKLQVQVAADLALLAAEFQTLAVETSRLRKGLDGLLILTQTLYPHAAPNKADSSPGQLNVKSDPVSDQQLGGSEESRKGITEKTKSVAAADQVHRMELRNISTTVPPCNRNIDGSQWGSQTAVLSLPGVTRVISDSEDEGGKNGLGRENACGGGVGALCQSGLPQEKGETGGDRNGELEEGRSFSDCRIGGGGILRTGPTTGKINVLSALVAGSESLDRPSYAISTHPGFGNPAGSSSVHTAPAHRLMPLLPPHEHNRDNELIGQHSVERGGDSAGRDVHNHGQRLDGCSGYHLDCVTDGGQPTVNCDDSLLLQVIPKKLVSRTACKAHTVGLADDKADEDNAPQRTLTGNGIKCNSPAEAALQSSFLISDTADTIGWRGTRVAGASPLALPVAVSSLAVSQVISSASAAEEEGKDAGETQFYV